MFDRTMFCLLIFGTAASALAGDGIQAGDWPQFRGHRAAGVADGQHPPVQWDVAAGTNVRWKRAIPGLGHASPVITGNCIFIVSAVGDTEDPSLKVGLYGDIGSVPDEGRQSWRLYCLNKRTGEVLWERTLHQGVPAIKRHTKASHANSTPATDGRHVIVSLGAEGLYCYDVCGRQVWRRDLGRLDSGYYVVPDAQWGFGSSPIIYHNMAIVQCDVQKDSYLAAFDIHSGSALWRTPRNEVPTWSTPTIHEGERTQLIVNGYRHAGGYDPYTGEELWRLGGGGDIPVPTPIVADGLILLSSAHGWLSPLCAVRPDARGEIKFLGDSRKKYVAWYKPRDGIYMQTPLAYQGLLYACRDNGVLSCYESQTGKRLYRERLGGGVGFTASPVAADGRIYFTSEDGDVFVVRAGPKFEILARNSVEEVCMATPAISSGMLIVRTQKHVYALGEQPAPEINVSGIQPGFPDSPVASSSMQTMAIPCQPNSCRSSCRRLRLRCVGYRACPPHGRAGGVRAR